MTRARSLLSVLLALQLPLLAPPSASAQAGAGRPEATCPGGRTVTADDLRAAGAGRIGDALRLVSPLSAWTPDGFDAEPRDGRGALALLVDGRPWRSGTNIEAGALDALPVAVSEVEAVVYCPGPRLVWGRAVGATLDVRTAPPPRAAALADFGNETGDPGPARYLRPDLPNQDHWGPDLEVVGRAGAAWGLVRSRAFLPTDTAIVARTGAAAAGFPEVDRRTAAVALRSRIAGARIGGRAAFAVGDELPFLPYAQHEVAVQRRAASAAAEVQRGRLGLLITGSAQRLRPPDRPGIADSLRARPRDEAEIDLALARAVGSGQEIGVAVGVRTLRTPTVTYRISNQVGFVESTAHESRTLAVVRAWTRLQSRDGRVEIDLSALADGGRPGAATALRVLVGPSARLTVGARSAPVWTPPLTYGYGPLRPDSANALDALVRTDAYALDLRLDGSRMRGPIEVRWGAGVWQARAPRLSVQSPGSSPLLFLGSTRERGARAESAVAWQRRALRLGADLAVQAVRYAPRATFRDRPEDLLSVDHAAPALAVGATVQWVPAARLSLHARAEASTSRAAVGGLSQAPTVGRVPSGVVLDLGVRRSVWGDRLALALVGHNVLGAPEQPALLGARLGPRLHIRLSGRF